MLVLPTGDGMAIGFLQGPELPLNLAIETHKMLSKYNKAKIPAEIIRVRKGIHSGAAGVFRSESETRRIHYYSIEGLNLFDLDPSRH